MGKQTFLLRLCWKNTSVLISWEIEMYPPVYLRTFFQYIFICSKETSASRFPRNISNHSKEATLLTQTLLSASYLPFIHCNDIEERGSLSPHPPLHCPRRKKVRRRKSPQLCKKAKKAIQWSTYSATFFPVSSRRSGEGPRFFSLDDQLWERFLSRSLHIVHFRLVGKGRCAKTGIETEAW